MYTHTHTVEYYSAIRRNKSESVPVRQMKVELIIQSETQKEKNKYGILTYIYIYMESRKIIPINPFTHRKRKTDIKNRLVETTEEGESGMNSSETYTLPYAKQLASGKFLYNTGSSMWCSVTSQRGGIGWWVGGQFKREGPYVYLWLIHFVLCQKPT